MAEMMMYQAHKGGPWQLVQAQAGLGAGMEGLAGAIFLGAATFIAGGAVAGYFLAPASSSKKRWAIGGAVTGLAVPIAIGKISSAIKGPFYDYYGGGRSSYAPTAACDELKATCEPAAKTSGVQSKVTECAVSTSDCYRQADLSLNKKVGAGVLIVTAIGVWALRRAST